MSPRLLTAWSCEQPWGQADAYWAGASYTWSTPKHRVANTQGSTIASTLPLTKGCEKKSNRLDVVLHVIASTLFIYLLVYHIYIHLSPSNMEVPSQLTTSINAIANKNIQIAIHTHHHPIPYSNNLYDKIPTKIPQLWEPF